MMNINKKLLNNILNEIDKKNSTDKRIRTEGIPEEVFYGQKMSEVLQEFYPDASPELQIACRGQHIQRWLFPRNKFPKGRIGYLKWRKSLYQKHSHLLSQLLQKFPLPKQFINRIVLIVSKSDLKSNPDTQALEDIACLVFMKYYLIDFAKKHERKKLISILKKTWRKMSLPAQKFATKNLLANSPIKEIIQEAIPLPYRDIEGDG